MGPRARPHEEAIHCEHQKARRYQAGVTANDGDIDGRYAGVPKIRQHGRPSEGIGHPGDQHVARLEEGAIELSRYLRRNPALRLELESSNSQISKLQ